MLEKYTKITKKKNISLDQDKDKKEFSSWVKKYEKNNNLQENKSTIKKNKITNFLNDFNYKLKLMYLHCELSFPYVEIDVPSSNLVAIIFPSLLEITSYVLGMISVHLA